MRHKKIRKPKPIGRPPDIREMLKNMFLSLSPDDWLIMPEIAERLYGEVTVCSVRAAQQAMWRYRRRQQPLGPYPPVERIHPGRYRLFRLTKPESGEYDTPQVTRSSQNKVRTTDSE